MAYDEGHAQLMRDALGAAPGLSEKRMFGGLAFLLDGHMVCGVHERGAMFRVGKDAYAEALGIDGVREMAFTGRPMTGFVETDEAALAEDALLARLIGMSRAFVATLPPKPAKPPRRKPAARKS